MVEGYHPHLVLEWGKDTSQKGSTHGPQVRHWQLLIGSVVAATYIGADPEVHGMQFNRKMDELEALMQ